MQYNKIEVMQMPYNDAQRKATNKYIAEAYDQIPIRVAKGESDKIKVHAESCGMSLNAFIVEAIAEKMGK